MQLLITLGWDSIRLASKLIFPLYVKFELKRIKGLHSMSASGVIRRTITGTKKQPGGWCGLTPLLVRRVTYSKVSQHTLVSKLDSGVARDKINVSSENGGEGDSPQKLSTFSFKLRR